MYLEILTPGRPAGGDVGEGGGAGDVEGEVTRLAGYSGREVFVIAARKNNLTCSAQRGVADFHFCQTAVEVGELFAVVVVGGVFSCKSDLKAQFRRPGMDESADAVARFDLRRTHMTYPARIAHALIEAFAVLVELGDPYECSVCERRNRLDIKLDNSRLAPDL